MVVWWFGCLTVGGGFFDLVLLLIISKWCFRVGSLGIWLGLKLVFLELCFNVFDLRFVLVVGLYRWVFGGLGDLGGRFGFTDWLVVYVVCLCEVESWMFGVCVWVVLVVWVVWSGFLCLSCYGGFLVICCVGWFLILVEFWFCSLVVCPISTCLTLRFEYLVLICGFDDLEVLVCLWCLGCYEAEFLVTLVFACLFSYLLWILVFWVFCGLALFSGCLHVKFANFSVFGEIRGLWVLVFCGLVLFSDCLGVKFVNFSVFGKFGVCGFW